MECIRCWKDSKYQFCRKCKEERHKAGAIISQNKTKLRNLLDHNILEPELFNKFLLYTDNIIKYGKIYMDFVEKKHNTRFKIISWTCILASVLLSLYSISSLVILSI